MARPMALVAQTIKSTIVENEDDMIELDKNEESRKELEETLRVKVSTINALPVDKPRTTCHHADCIRHASTGSWDSDGKEVLKTVYESMCHIPCSLGGVQVEKYWQSKIKSLLRHGRRYLQNLQAQLESPLAYRL